MRSFLAAGLIVLAYVIGRWAIDRCIAPRSCRSQVARSGLALVLGVAMLTPPLVVFAVAGLFKIPWLGSFAWVLAIAGMIGKSRTSSKRQTLDAPDIVALVAAITFVLFAVSGRDETLGSGRDQQVYAEAAVALSQRGSAAVLFAPLDDADRALLRHVSGVLIPDMTDIHAGVDYPITLSHPLGWPVWLAVAHTMFGVDGVYAANSVIFALGGLLFFALLRCIVPAGIAIAGTLLLFALPSSLWIAGISLSEPMTMTLLLAVPLFSMFGMKRSQWLIAAVVTGASFVRIDAALAVPATIAAALLASRAPSNKNGLSAMRHFSFIQFISHAAVFIGYWFLFHDYLRDTFDYVTVITAASVALLLGAWLVTPRTLTYVKQLTGSRFVRVCIVASLVSLFFYAVAIRPTYEPFSIIHHGILDLEGKRDFREDSVLNLATYLSWPILLATVGGLCYAVWNRWLASRGLMRSLVVVLGVGPGLLYLWYPMVSADHPWAIRRFVPTVIPYALLFAAILAHVMTRRIGRLGTAVGAAALVAPYTFVAANFAPQSLLFKDNSGMTDQIESIAEALPNELVVSVGVDQNVVAGLLVAYGKPVVFVNRDLLQTEDFVQVSNWIDAKSRLGRPAWLLHGPEVWSTGAIISPQRSWLLSRSFVAPAYRAPSRKIENQTSKVTLSRVDGLDRSFTKRMFGGDRVWGASGRHFFETEVAPFGQFRYTDGLSWIDVAAEAMNDAQTLKVDLFSYAKPGERRWLHVLINETPAWGGTVGAGVTTLRVQIPRPVASDVARIKLISEQVDATEIGPDDHRVGIGIGLIGMRLLRPGEPVADGPGMNGFRSKLALSAATVLPITIRTTETGNFVLDVSNTGTAYWPTVRDLGDAAGAVQIALRWYRRDAPDRFVGDNRWPMAISLLAGDHTRVRVPLAPIGMDGKPLPPGEYDVRVGMVRETLALFEQNGDAVLSFPVVVTR